MTPEFPLRIERMLAAVSGGERSIPLALHAVVEEADESGSALFDRVAVRYREDYLHALRVEGKDAEHEAGRLSLDEVRGYLARFAIPRLVELGVLQRVEQDLFDPEARVRIAEPYWTEIAPVRSELADTLTHSVEHPSAEVPITRARPGGSTLEAVGLVKMYRRRKVVNDVHLRLQQGEIVGLLGPNGAGKTTTFYMIVGLIDPLAGRILMDGAEITDMPMYQRARRGIGYLSQEPSVFRKLTVEENLLAILETLPLTEQEKQERLERLLD